MAVELLDPTFVQDASHHLHSLSSLLLSDGDVASPFRAMGSAPDAAAVDAALKAVTGAVDPATGEAVAAAADPGNGWFGFLAGPIELLLQGIHTGLMSAGMGQNSWGISIILMTVVIKLVTFPLTKSQLESTNKMQTLQPTIKGIQAKYQSNPEVMNQKIAEVYQTNEVNPLAGCLPSIVQIPVFIGLYRSVLNLAKENQLDESFLFLPNLEGPTYGADPAHGSDWLFKNWVDGVPSLGWPATIAFLSIPIFLVISQIISMQLMQPKTDDAQANQANVVLKILPFMIGWFALNVPSALGIYWVINNIVTTASTLYVRSLMPPMETAAAGGGAAAMSSSAMDASVTDFNPTSMNERAVGFGSGDADMDGMKAITPMDAEILSEGVAGDGIGGDGPDIPAAPGSKRGGTKKKKKRRKN